MQGGVGDFTREVGLALSRLGAEVTVISSLNAGSAREHGERTDGPVTTERDGGSVTLLPVVERWDFSSWATIVGSVSHLKPQVLNIQYQTAAYQMHPAVNFLPWRLRRLSERPRMVTTFHDLKLPYLFPKAGPVRRWVTRVLIRGSVANIVTNVEDRAQAESYGACGLHLIPIGSNIKPQAPAGYDRDRWRERWGVGSEEVLLSYFGFLNESKGGGTLLRALAELVHSGQEVKLLMIGGRVGSSDPTNIAYLQEMEHLIQELGLTRHIRWTGYVDGPEVSASFWSSDICVLPYRDGVSFRRGTLMAALAHGLPIVSTYPRVAVEGIIENANMALVPPDQPQVLAGRIAELAASPALRRRLARGAAELSQRFSWESIAEETMQVYEEVLETPR